MLALEQTSMKRLIEFAMARQVQEPGLARACMVELCKRCLGGRAVTIIISAWCLYAGVDKNLAVVQVVEA